MAEYIEREALMKHISANGDPDKLPDGYKATPNDVFVFAIAAVETAPAADVVERKRGEWVKDHDGYEYCSNCSRYMPVTEVTGDPSAHFFCPNCGADMRGNNNG